MKVYLVCPVRNPTYDCAEIVNRAERDGHEVHWPPRDVDQDDPTGSRICAEHATAMRGCDEVWIVWDKESKGSHFDLGMAYILGKPLRLLHTLHADNDGKSYLKVIKEQHASTNRSTRRLAAEPGADEARQLSPSAG